MMIRQASEADTPALVRMTGNFLKGTAYGAIVSFQPETIARLIPTVLGTGVIYLALAADTCPRTFPDAAVALQEFRCRRCGRMVREHGLQPIGFIAIAALESPMSGEVIAEELAWWVEPAYRHGTAGPKLLRAAEAWTAKRGIAMLKMVAPAGSDVGRFYERLGYRAVETAYTKML